ncbi:MAG: leucyl aminopeptidase [Alphaproteobacteria bacterium]|nr:leucyl aminopeptidase [Alphaproteobacteria bacterium]
MNVAFAEAQPSDADTLVVGVLEDRTLTPSAAELDRTLGGMLTRAMGSGRFTGARDKLLDVVAPSGIAAARVVLVGLGKAAALDDLGVQSVGGALCARLNAVGARHAAILVDELAGTKVGSTPPAALVASAIRLRGYRFDKYQTKQKPEDKPTLERLTIVTKAAAAAAAAYGYLDKVVDGVFFTRDLVSEPANVIFPQALAEQARTLSALGVEVEILGDARMGELGMGALLGVGQGSVRESQLIVMRWNGGKTGDKPVAFVGKGVCFDTGGISIKPAAGMEEMKYDMAGAGAVIGLLKALAGRKAKVNAVGVCAAVENMPSGNAQRPGDVVTSMSGQTIEVINTDAEGRLILSDALWYTHTNFKPKAMIDLATLTGAVVVALGTYKGGMFSNNDDLAAKLAAAGGAVGEPLWRLPLGDEYDRDINSDIADMKNVGKNREAGSIAGAVFLQRFVGDTPWAHLDIAGMAWAKKDFPLVPKGASGYGVRLLDRLVRDNYEGS